METLDGRVNFDDDDDDDEDGDLGLRRREDHKQQTSSFFDKLRSNNIATGSGGKPRRNGKGKRVTFKLNEQSSHQYKKLTG